MEEAPDPAELMREKLQKDLETLASIPEEGVCGAAFEYPDVSFALSDDGKSATLQSPDGWQVKCISYRLKGPSSLHDQVVSTRALDGTRTVEWDEWTATLNYHPDQGIRFIIQHD